MCNFDRNLTLDELENDFWLEPEYDSNLVIKCHSLRKIPLNQLTIENLRMLIGQEIGLVYLVPISMEYLEENTWCQGDYYNGDLLQSVLKINIDFWKSHSELFARLSEIMIGMETMNNLYLNTLSPAWLKILEDTKGTV